MRSVLEVGTGAGARGVRKGPGGSLEWPWGHGIQLSSHRLGPGNTNSLRWVLPLPTHPGYTPPGTPLLLHPMVASLGSAQRLADSVKTLFTGSPTYRHATSVDQPSRDIRGSTVTRHPSYLRFINNAHLCRLTEAVHVQGSMRSRAQCAWRGYVTAPRMPDGKSAVH